MQNTVWSALLVLLLRSYSTIAATEPSLGEQIEKLAPRAAGVAQVEVVDIKEVDMRGGDGPLYLEVRLRLLRGTGATTDTVHIIKELGGFQNPASPPWKPHGPVKLDTFKKGERYWVAFSSQYDGERCPQGVVNSWPDKDGPKPLAEAIRTDHYSHRPQYHPESGLTHSYRTEKDKKSWWARMERDGKLLWEVKLPGERYKVERFESEWRLLHRKQWPSGLGHAAENRSGWYLFAATASRLEPANGYQLPAEDARLTYALDADTGKTAAVWVSRVDLGPTSNPSVVQYFDLKTGRVRREERYDFLKNGGLAAGANEEKWLRKLVRTYDPSTGRLKSEEVFRHTTSPEGSKYIPVNKQ